MDKQVNILQQHYKQLVYIYRDFAKERHSSLQYKRQDRANNGNSDRIQSVFCEDTLHVKRIIVV